jgi:tetratricopeptide (TPR) repeat protein
VACAFDTPPVNNAIGYSLCKLASAAESEKPGVTPAAVRTAFVKPTAGTVPTAVKWSDVHDPAAAARALGDIAVEYTTRVVEARPASAPFWKQHATALQTAGKFSSAADAFGKALELQSEVSGGKPFEWQWDAVYKRAKCLKKADRHSHAAEAFRAALALRYVAVDGF